MTKFVLSTIGWLEAIAKKEIEKQWGKIEDVVDRVVTFSWDLDLMAKVNLWSRVGNKLYLLLAEKDFVDNFDNLYDIMADISWKKYFKKSYPIVVQATSIRSELHSTPTIQKIWKKCIINALTDWSGERVIENEWLEKMEILVLFIDNKVRILLNTSWPALHMRGYRTEAWEAPIKENLAAALVWLANWRFRDNFYDPFCGSWTIAIEAVMMARNMAPWVMRKFAFQRWDILPSEILDNEKKLARKREYTWEYKVFASDIDPEVLEIAKENAKRAWVEDNITFSVKDFRDFAKEELEWTMVSNPPYGLRLEDEDLKWLYNNIDRCFRINPELKWWIISSFHEFDGLIKKDTYKKRKLYNWAEKCYFWKRK